MADKLIQIRLSHLLSHSGVGAIVRGTDELVVVKDIRSWTNREGMPDGKLIPYVERVRVALGIEEELREPPVAKDLANGQVDGTCVPATRFPSWMRCPTCGAMYSPAQLQNEFGTPSCNHTKCSRHPKLEQVTWVLVHSNGHLAEVPWHFLVHRNVRDSKQSQCNVRDQLWLIERRFENRRLECGACRAETRFRGDERVDFGQNRMQPWARETAEESGEEPAQVLTVNDTRVYSPEAQSVLVIPPESRVRKGTVVDSLYRNSSDRIRIDEARTRLAKKSILKSLATKYRCTPENIESAMDDIESGYPLYGENFTKGQLRESEFQAFLEVLPNQQEDEDLVTQNKSDEWRRLEKSDNLNTAEQKAAEAVHHLVRVDRLKAVKVFRGFTRLDGKEKVPPDLVRQSDWLPAIELYGEGIFITLDEERLKAWEQTPGVASRLGPLSSRFTQSGRDAPNPLTARFMLLHTLSHLLMRQIESEGGYPAASMTERIYCSKAPVPMAGILISVAVPDIAGSLGGLAELSEPKRFLGILIRALDHSRWCSLDPVCSEHEGQGPGLLNRAACHACTLVPEPACDYGNILLDRSFVKGDAENNLTSFFGIT